MKISLAIISFLFLTGCQFDKNMDKSDQNNYNFYVGTYTHGESEGIYKYVLQKNGSLKLDGLVARSDNPSFLTRSADQKFLVVVNEVNIDSTGTVESYKITKDSLLLISRSLSGGTHPCFVTSNDEGFILSANYTGGSIGLLQVNEFGELTPLLDVQQHSGKGTTERQQGPHAHSAWFVPESDAIISVDLGTNELWFSNLDKEHQQLLQSNQNKLKMPPGAGPRHLVFHPNRKWIYVLNELANTVMLVEKSDEKYNTTTSISTLISNYKGINTAADIHISSNGKFVYASNRGHNSIAIFEVNMSDGSLKFLGHESTRGDGPRNFSLSPDEKYLLVANQYSNNIVSFERDGTTGLLTYAFQIAAPTPVCIVF